LGYHWLASGCTPTYLQFHLWVREHPISDSKVHHSINCQSKVLHLPHADIIFDIGDIIHLDAVTEKRKSDGFRLMRIGPYYHEDNVLHEAGPWFMASAHDLKTQRPGFAKDAGVKMILDSGGAQLKFGITSFVDREEVIKIFNLYADAAMALELPPRRKLSTRRDVDGHPMALRMLADVQRRNNEFFAANKRKDLQLLNVAHGITGDDFRRWIATVTNPALEGWAISYDSDLDPYCIWRGAAVLFQEFGAAAGWMHLFGVSGFLTIPLMSWLGKRFPNLTSDSSSWVQNVSSYKYLHSRYDRLEDISIGEAFAKMPQSDADSLEPYCSCQVCQAMNTFGAYRELFHSDKQKADKTRGSLIAYPALAAHNMLAIKHAVASWNERAARMTYEEFRAEIRRCFPKARKGQNYGNNILHMLEYLECALENGPEYADLHVARTPQRRPFLYPVS